MTKNSTMTIVKVSGDKAVLINIYR